MTTPRRGRDNAGPSNGAFVRSTVRALVPHIAAAFVVGACLWLMTWQLDRADDKRARLAEVADAPTRPLAELDPATATPTRVAGRGRFDGDRQVLLDNRVFNRQPGVHVLTPWVLDDGRIVLVDRGWAAWPDRSAPRPDPVAPPTERIAGLLVDPPEVGLRLGETAPLDPDDWPNLLTYHADGPLRAVFGDALLPQIVQLDPAHPGHLTGADWPVVTFGPERHIGYAVQWGLMAAVVAAIWIVLTLRARRRATTRKPTT
ncbi:SURF1 family protein [Halomonas denitrificans]|nr:SURF1 family protein [Halomonas denitrificans]